MLREKPEVVCRKCLWCRLYDLGPLDPDKWLCGHTDLATDKGWCPVTGREQTNHPLCRVVNADGKCKHFQRRVDG